jgi:hypothetical protein
MQLENKVFRLLSSHSCTARCTSPSSANWRPSRAFLRGPNGWKSEGAKSGLWSGCSRTSLFSFWMLLMVRCAVWGRAFSCNRTTPPCDKLPLWFVQIAGLSLFLKHFAVIYTCYRNTSVHIISRLCPGNLGTLLTTAFRHGLWRDFFERRCLVLPLHAVPFGFWFIMMDSGFNPSDDAI